MQAAIEAARARIAHHGLEPTLLYEDDFRAILRAEIGWQGKWCEEKHVNPNEYLWAAAGESAVEMYVAGFRRPSDSVLS